MPVLEFIDLAANLVPVGVFCLVVVILPAVASIRWAVARMKRTCPNHESKELPHDEDHC